MKTFPARCLTIVRRINMKRFVWSSVMVLVAGVLFMGCESTNGLRFWDQGSDAEIALCGGCGHIKGSDACCAEDAAVCDGCGLAKGSPGCCNMTKGEDVALCTGCGHIKGSEACCAEGAVICEKCGMAAGSPGCCKIEMADG